MFITDAWAQSAGGGDGMGMIVQFVPLILIFAVMYLLVFRPQSKRMKAHRAMIAAVKRGDVVVTSGGIVGKVKKVSDDTDEAIVEIANGIEVRVVRSTLAEVRSKTEPAVAPAPKPVEERKSGNGASGEQ